MYARFGLTLMVTHACNLRCTYCYTGEKARRSMQPVVGRVAIERAVASLRRGGSLELGFFGGEPLLEAALIAELIACAQLRTAAAGVELVLAMTTNGTIAESAAWSLMLLPELDLWVSCDGLAEIHDRHRLTVRGQGTSNQVRETIRRLVEARRDFGVIVVVRPDTVERLAESLADLRALGVKSIHPSLDLWARWSDDAIRRLERSVAICADQWREWIPGVSITWFDEKLARLAGVRAGPTARCGFGDGEIAVAPSGRLYPCERLIGEDAADNPMALPGHVLDGSASFLALSAPGRAHAACADCAMATDCNTTCRCSNYVRTGNVTTPDRLLCALNQACLTETARVMNQPVQIAMRI